MDYKFLDSKIEQEPVELHDSKCIDSFLKQNYEKEILKAIDFFNSDESLLYVHGFLGTGKRQFINYITEFLDKDVVKLEYYCKAGTVCDDIQLSFIDKIEKSSLSKVININTKITTLGPKLEHYIESAKKSFVIIFHSLDYILQDNLVQVISYFENFAKYNNIKFIVSTRALIQDVMGSVPIGTQIFLKGFTRENLKEFLALNNVNVSEATLKDFYSYTRGYYYYTALTLKIIQSMKLSLNEFLEKFAMSGMSFDSYLGAAYINLVPTPIRNFFWFLRTLRHGISLNALAVLELYDEFSIEYLVNNLMAYIADDIIYVQDYFQQDIDISIPDKTQIKLHKYITGIYEKELKVPLQSRQIMISRQAMRAEIEYHNNCIDKILNKNEEPNSAQQEAPSEKTFQDKKIEAPKSENAAIETQIAEAESNIEANNLTRAIEIYLNICESEKIDLITKNDVRHKLAYLYKRIGEYNKSQHYYELVEKFYKNNNEIINLNYLYYEITGLYYLMYKHERAIETIKKVIYSVDTPQSLLVDSCTLLGNIYSDMNNSEEAFSYYKKALESLDNNTSDETIAELYFKFALANDEKGDVQTAMEYYVKCIAIGGNNLYKAPAYSNLGSCYYENDNLSDARDCFEKAYKMEKSANNYDGIFYTSSYLAKICSRIGSDKTLLYLLDAKQSAEFINEDFYIVEATVALGDFYYNNVSTHKKALIEYFRAYSIAKNLGDAVDIDKIEQRIQDMKLRMDKDEFSEIEKKYE